MLPLFWAWPKARRLQRERRLSRPIPVGQFVVPATIWIVILFASYWFVSWVFTDTNSYVLGILIGSFQTGRLIFQPNPAMDADFDSAYAPYLRETAALVAAP